MENVLQKPDLQNAEVDLLLGILKERRAMSVVELAAIARIPNLTAERIVGKLQQENKVRLVGNGPKLHSVVRVHVS